MEGSAPTPGDLVRSVVSSPGRSLDPQTSSVVGSALGRDVSGVRLHEGPEAAASASAVGAELYASGQHVVAPHGLDTRSDEGLFKTVHEFVHIGQQASGPVDGTATADGLKISDPSDRFEQEADAVAGQAVAARSGLDGPSGGRPAARPVPGPAILAELPESADGRFPLTRPPSPSRPALRAPRSRWAVP